MKRITNYNNLKCSLKIAELRLKLIKELNYQNYDDEIEKLNNYIVKCKRIINNLDKRLKTLNNIELYLFKKITCGNTTITKAIEETANHYYYDVCTIWKYYYPKIKPMIEELEIKEDL